MTFPSTSISILPPTSSPLSSSLAISTYANPQKLLQIKAHTESCRALRFSTDGRAILTGSRDCSILASDEETGAEIVMLENAHSAPPFRLINLTESTVASGDDNGHIKVWDTRQRTCCNSFDIHTDYISDLTLAPDSMKLLATSGDGTLLVCYLRRNKNGRKVICRCQSGTLLLYTWGCFKDCSDRFTDLSPHSVDAMLKLDEDRIITGTENGLINLVGILPNRIIQPIAEHSEYPVERLAFFS